MQQHNRNILPFQIDIILVTHKERDLKKELEIADNTQEKFNLIPTCRIGESASINRNYGLDTSTSEIAVMLDDDITGFYQGWLTDLVQPMIDDPAIIIASVRLLDENRNLTHMMGGDNIPNDWGVHTAKLSSFRNYKKVPTSCIAIRKNDVRFDEGFKGSGYEDTTYINYINLLYPTKSIVVNNNCKLIHLNEMKNQGGKYWEHNHSRYLELFPDDVTAQKQQDWTGNN
jgi:hypothetical protein